VNSLRAASDVGLRFVYMYAAIMANIRVRSSEQVDIKLDVEISS